jgi:hypothetical protein
MTPPQERLVKCEVEQRHIDAGKPGLPHVCPITLALREAEPTFRIVWTFPFGAHVIARTDERGLLVSTFPFAVRRWLYNFDKGEAVQPTSLTLSFTPFHSDTRRHRVRV